MPRSAPEGSGTEHPRVARVAVEGAPFHLGDTLDYLAGDASVGQRVTLSLAGRSTRGLVMDVGDTSSVEPSRLRALGRRLGEHRWADDGDLALYRWASERFGASLGDVVRHALPGRVVDEERRAQRAGWWPPQADQGERAAPADVTSEDGAPGVDWGPYGSEGTRLRDAVDGGAGSFLLQPAPGDDLAALVADLAARCVTGGRDVLLVVPGPVSEVADRVLAVVDTEGALDLRGGPSPRLAYRGWLRARAGRVHVAVGERGAAFVPMDRLGLAVVVDEADPTHKERRSPRHHVREVLLERARRAGGVGLCTSDVPSAAARALLRAGRLQRVSAAADVIAERRPVVRLETGDLEARARISRGGMALLRDAVERGGYGVVLAARRGEGRALVCGRCGDLLRCSRCRASVARASDGRWWCAACGTHSERTARCERCGPGPLVPLAAGAGRLGEELGRSLSAPVAVLEGHAPALPEPPAVLVMTRGSVLDRPPPGGPVHGVVLPDLDGALRRPTLDAAEDALRLAFRVAGWTVAAGEPRTAVRAQVVVETRDTEHHALLALRDWDAAAFWDAEEVLRAPLGLPPLRRAVRLEGPAGLDADGALREGTAPGDTVVGPLPIEAGRAAFLVLCDDRTATLAALRPLRERCSRDGADLRVDVDPVDLG